MTDLDVALLVLLEEHVAYELMEQFPPAEVGLCVQKPSLAWQVVFADDETQPQWLSIPTLCRAIVDHDDVDALKEVVSRLAPVHAWFLLQGAGRRGKPNIVRYYIDNMGLFDVKHLYQQGIPPKLQIPLFFFTPEALTRDLFWAAVEECHFEVATMLAPHANVEHCCFHMASLCSRSDARETYVKGLQWLKKTFYLTPAPPGRSAPGDSEFPNDGPFVEELY